MKLSVEDFLLLREVFSWARANGWQRSLTEGDEVPAWQRLTTWRWMGPARREVFVEWVRHDFNPDDWRVVGSIPEDGVGVEFGQDGDHLAVDRAVDALVAVGVLPLTLSSAYRAGQASAYTRDEWRVRSSQLLRGWSINPSLESAVESLQSARGRYPDAWIEHRRTGATEWSRADA